jgi:hypothetical protein
MKFIPLILMLLVAGAAADEPRTDQESPWKRLFNRQAAEWTIGPAARADETYRLVEQPLLQWSQPVRGGQEGLVRLWTDRDGRPAVVATLFVWPAADGRQGVAHEMQSLAEEPLTGRWGERVRWSPTAAGVTWHELRGASVPASTPAERLREMRKLAARFQATTVDREGRTLELRLLPRPVFRYAVPAGGQAIDGGLFALVQGTDTELILWLEAARTAEGPRWHYAFARMTDLETRVSLGDAEVFRVSRTDFDRPAETYFNTTVEFYSKPPE